MINGCSKDAATYHCAKPSKNDVVSLEEGGSTFEMVMVGDKKRCGRPADGRSQISRVRGIWEKLCICKNH